MKCRACRGPMRPTCKPFVPVVVPIAAALAGVGGGLYLLQAHVAQLPVAGAIAVVCAVGGVLLTSLHKVGVSCLQCSATQPMSPEEEKQLAAEDRHGEIEKMRDQLASTLRPQIEDDLRPQME